MIHDAEGTYNHERKAVLITVITRAEFNEFKQIMKQVDPSAFVSVSENVIFWDDLLKQIISGQKKPARAGFYFSTILCPIKLAITNLFIAFSIIDDLENSFKGNTTKLQTIDIDIGRQVELGID